MNDQEYKELLIERELAGRFIKDLVVMATEDARLINGLMLLFQLSSKCRHIVDVRDFNSYMQNMIYLGTVAHERAEQMFRNGVLQRANWDSILGEEV